MKKTVALSAIITAGLLSGCASFNVRVHPYNFYGPSYPAVEYDCEAIQTLYESPWFGDKLLIPFSISDLAPSVVIDTFFLPFDLYEYER